MLEMRSHAACTVRIPGMRRARAHLNILEGAREVAAALRALIDIRIEVAAALRALLDERPEQGPSFQTEESTRKA